MEKSITKHFDIYYFKDSTVEKGILYGLENC